MSKPQITKLSDMKYDPARRGFYGEHSKVGIPDLFLWQLEGTEFGDMLFEDLTKRGELVEK